MVFENIVHSMFKTSSVLIDKFSASMGNSFHEDAPKNSEGIVPPDGDDKPNSPIFVPDLTQDSSTSSEMAEEGSTDNGSSHREELEECSSSSMESETASCKSCTSDSESQSNPKGDFPWPSSFFRTLKTSARKFQTLPPLGVPKFQKKRKNKSVGEAMEPILGGDSPLDPDFYCLKSSWKNFTLAEIKAATNNFSPDNLIGQGGYAKVYKGVLGNGQHVAVKRLTTGRPEEMTADFLSELGIIAHVDHPNTAKLVGYGVEGGMHLILRLSTHGSVASLLNGANEKLKWAIRYQIALGSAEGLLYLHEGGQKRIIHRDIKASNILLTEDFEVQISDFGLAKWLPDQCTHLNVNTFEGTFGYMPPEVFMHGIVDEKTDVFAYGVLLLELITGRLALDESQKSLVMWAKPLIEKNCITELVDPSLSGVYDLKQMNRLVLTASLCISHCPAERPRMRQVVQFLRGDEVSLEVAIRAQMSSNMQRAYSDDLFDADDYNSSKCVNDVDEHMRLIALET